MIRLPSSRILPGQDDIHHHLERVFARVAARYDDIAPDSEDDADDEDDYGYDLASIPKSDLSFTPSTSPADEGFHSESGSGFKSAVECQRRSQSRYGNVVSSVDDDDDDDDDDNDPGDNDQQYIGQDQSQDQDSHREHASFETAPESIYTPGVDDGELSSAGMSYMEMARAHHSLRENRLSTYASIGNLMALGIYPWPGHSLLPIHRVNPRVLMAVPEDDTWPTQQIEVSSLGTLFNSLSLNTLPEDTHSHQADQSENQKPGASQTKKDQSQTFDTLDKDPSFSKASQISDIQHEMPGSIQDDNAPRTDVLMNNTPLQSNFFEPNDTEPDTENESNSVRGSTMTSQNRGRGRKSGNATRGGRRSNTSQAPVQNDTPVADSKKSSRGARGSRQTSRSVSRSSVVATDNQTSNAPQNQSAGPQTAPATQSHPMNYTANSRPTNDQPPATISNPNTVNNSTSLAQPPISQTPADSQSSMTPANANGGMSLQARDPERRRHMMEVSRIFQSHVNEMITGVENEDDNAEDFGLGEIRRRPMGAWYD